MSRPRHETQEDRDNEARVAGKFAEFWCAYAYKMPDSYILDFAIENGESKINTYIEIKCRPDLSHDKHPSAIMPLKKLQAARTFAARVFFVWEYTDGIYFVQATGGKEYAPDFVSWGGRKDRNDPDDVEPWVHYKNDRLTKL